jgi:hypothetical protein
MQLISVDSHEQKQVQSQVRPQAWPSGAKAFMALFSNYLSSFVIEEMWYFVHRMIRV